MEGGERYQIKVSEVNNILKSNVGLMILLMSRNITTSEEMEINCPTLDNFQFFDDGHPCGRGKHVSTNGILSQEHIEVNRRTYVFLIFRDRERPRGRHRNYMLSDN